MAILGTILSILLSLGISYGMSAIERKRLSDQFEKAEKEGRSSPQIQKFIDDILGVASSKGQSTLNKLSSELSQIQTLAGYLRGGAARQTMRKVASATQDKYEKRLTEYDQLEKERQKVQNQATQYSMLTDDVKNTASGKQIAADIKSNAQTLAQKYERTLGGN